MQKLGSAGVKIFKATTAAVATGVTALGTAALTSYADYEQLVGGVQTLFAETDLSLQDYAESIGKTAEEAFDEWGKMTAGARIVQNNADEAYKTAGMSANKYMETVTSFSASLLQSLEGDTVKAADAADQAIIDMSDNANKMGSSMESIQNAYQGFAKQNYTMLDNLKLGYGGTKTEMERLLKDAEAISGVKYDISNLADVYEAIHVIQTEMGITGTTAKEASTTISGSLSSVKASWENLTVAIATGEDIDVKLEEFIDSVITAGENLVPRVVEIGKSIVGIVKDEIIPGIAKKAPEVVKSGYELLSKLVSGFTASIPEKLPLLLDLIQKFADGIAEKVPIIIQKGFELLGKFVDGIVSGLPTLIEKVPTIITTFANVINDNFPTILLKGAEIIWKLITGIISAIPTLIQNIPKIITAIVSVIQAFQWTNLGKKIITWFKNGITNMVGAVKNAGTAVHNAIKNVLDKLPSNLSKIGKNAITKLVNAIKGLLSSVSGAGTSVFNAIKNALNNLPSTLSTLGQNAITGIKNAITNGLGNVKSAASDIASGIIDAVSSLPSKMVSIGKNIIDGIWSGISSSWGWLTDKVGEVANSLFRKAKEKLGINSPSRKFKWLAEMCVAGWDEGSEGLMDAEPFVKSINANFATLRMNASGAKATGGFTGSRGVQQIININQPISTPDEMARAIRLESRYGLMRGIAYG